MLATWIPNAPPRKRKSWKFDPGHESVERRAARLSSKFHFFGYAAVIPENDIPRHVAIIMDGNGRWAAKRGLQRSEGHKAGARAVRTIVTRCRELGIGCLTLYAFSSENWSRPPAEIATLFNLLLEFLANETALMLEKGIALNVVGDIAGLPVPQRIALKHCMAKTASCRDMRLNLALNYGGRAEIVHAVQKIMKSGIRPDSVDEALISGNLYTAGMPDPDLIIRTSGEMRLSNFLLYQCAYSEFYFTPVLWPDFDADELQKALLEYSTRSRRFGQTGEQLEGDCGD